MTYQAIFFRAFGITAAVIATCNQASAQSIFTGSCERANLLKRESTVDKLITSKGYRGVMYIRSGNDSNCEYLFVYNLAEQSRSIQQVVYRVKRHSYSIDLGTAKCAMRNVDSTVYGDITFSTRITISENICSFDLIAAVRERDSGDWIRDWTQTVILLKYGDIVINQHISDGFVTPMALTAIR